MDDEASKHFNMNTLKLSSYFTHHHVQHSEILCSSHSVHLSFPWISEQTEFISLYMINWLIFIIWKAYIYHNIRNKIQINSSLERVNCTIRTRSTPVILCTWLEHRETNRFKMSTTTLLSQTPIKVIIGSLHSKWIFSRTLLSSTVASRYITDTTWMFHQW